MNWNPDTLPTPVREKMLAVGQKFTSEQTRDQARDCLQFYEQHKHILDQYGFGDDLAKSLQLLKATLESADATKLTAKAGGKKTAIGLHTSTRTAKKTRLRAVGQFRTAVVILGTDGTPESQEAVADIEGRLARVTPAGDDVKALVTQLDVLQAGFDIPAVAQVTANTGGPATQAALKAAALDLTQKDAAHKKGIPTHKEQETMDVVDGLIVTLCRLARLAARSAADDLGQPAISKAFELKRLYP